MINIVIPMAGSGSRFSQAGYSTPKPFIDVAGLPMIWRVLENLETSNAHFILLSRQEHLEKERDLVLKLKERFNCTCLPISKLTEGTACTVLFAREQINNDTPLLIANSDQIVDMDISTYLQDAEERNLDGSILTFTDKEKNPKWSFAKIDEEGYVIEVQEKVVISQYATVGIYYFSQGRDFVNSAIDMIINNDRVNNEFYTCPTYNYLIKQNKKVGIYNIDFQQMHGLGTPQDLEKYLSNLSLEVS